MPTPIPSTLRLGVVEPTEAIAAFQRRELLQPSFAWQDVWQEEHSRMFAVAGVMRLDVLQIFKDELDAAIREGRDLRAFQKDIVPRLTAKGFWGDVEIQDPATGERRITRFDERRLSLIYGVNVRQSFAAGRWEEIERSKARLPFLMYRTMRDEQVRASHRPWDGVVLPVGHSWWLTHFAPCGWKCRCTVFALSQKDIDRRQAAGEKLTFEAPPVDLVTYVNPRSGEVSAVPRGVDPGFGYIPGRARDAELNDSMLRKALAAAPLSGAVAVAQAQADHPALVTGSTARLGAFVQRIASGKLKASGEQRMLGALAPATVRALESSQVQLGTAVVALRDTDLAAALATSGDAAALAAQYKALPQLMTRTRGVLQDLQDATRLVYLVDAGTDALAVLVQLATGQTAPLGPIPANRVVGIEPAGQRYGAARYRVLWGQR